MWQSVTQTPRWSRSVEHLRRWLIDKTVECQVLLEYGADASQAKDDGWSTLHIAARYADAEVVEVGDVLRRYIIDRNCRLPGPPRERS